MILPEGGLVRSLEGRGISRRKFLQFCAAMTATLALPLRYTDRVAQALEGAKRPILVWLEFQDCAGNTESMLRTAHPDIAEVVLDLFSWEYHEVVMAGAGHQAEAVLERILEEHAGQFIAVVEGAIPLADDGIYCTIGGRTALDIARTVLPKAALVIAAGACAWDGGLVAAAPNPTGAVGVSQAVSGLNLINLGGCPHNPSNTAAVLTHWVTFGEAPPLDRFRRPLFAYGHRIHDQCERRGHFDAGRFVEEWGDEGARKGWCLYKMGCKGPQAEYNCPTVRWNDGTSWPVKSGHGCVGCASSRFWDTRSPFYKRLPEVPGLDVDTTAGEVGVALLGLTAAGIAAHATAAAIRNARAATPEPPKES